jgi:hypothetical protein
MKSRVETYFFLAFYAFRSKVLVIVKKIRDPEKFIPDPDPRSSEKNHRIPGSESATLKFSLFSNL